MLEIRELNWQDVDAIYQVFKELPEDENGFMNQYYGIDKETNYDNNGHISPLYRG